LPASSGSGNRDSKTLAKPSSCPFSPETAYEKLRTDSSVRSGRVHRRADVNRAGVRMNEHRLRHRRV
jgi:hypothetical protein